MKKLGEILQAKKLVDSKQLNHALLLQKKCGSRLGDILLAIGAIGYYALYQAVAHRHNLEFVDLLAKAPDNHLLANSIPPETLLAKMILPWRRDEGGIITVAITEYDDETVSWCKRQFGSETKFVITSPFDIKRVIEREFGSLLEKESRLSLWQKAPSQSARYTMPENQKKILYCLIYITLSGMALAPYFLVLTFIAFCHVAFLATMVFKSVVFSAGIKSMPPQNWEEKLAALNEQTLPVYTILIPMYREAESLPGMMEAMKNMDYPAAKMDIKLVLEADDHETLNAAYALKPNYNFDIIRVPPQAPRTKPKACNYALRYAAGEMVTVFDADDRPEPTQLKKAIIAFRESPPDVACLQARLNYYNSGDNWLTRFFSLEYAILFDFTLPGLERMGIPIPLGGTSNHISLARLKELGEWDPYNVTEDADLGTRLCARGAKTRMLDSFTMEEAVAKPFAWIRQRSRWIKGYMQTWLVHMRSPRALYNSLGARGFIGFQFFIGLSCFTFLIAPISWVVSAFWVESLFSWHEFPFPAWLGWLAAANLYLNFATHWYLAFYSAAHYRKYRAQMLVTALIYPLYMIMHSIASYKALWQLIVKPHFWEKTKHGLAKETNGHALVQVVAKRH